MNVEISSIQHAVALACINQELSLNAMSREVDVAPNTLYAVMEGKGHPSQASRTLIHTQCRLFTNKRISNHLTPLGRALQTAFFTCVGEEDKLTRIRQLIDGFLPMVELEARLHSGFHKGDSFFLAGSAYSALSGLITRDEFADGLSDAELDKKRELYRKWAREKYRKAEEAYEDAPCGTAEKAQKAFLIGLCKTNRNVIEYLDLLSSMAPASKFQEVIKEIVLIAHTLGDARAHLNALEMMLEVERRFSSMKNHYDNQIQQQLLLLKGQANGRLKLVRTLVDTCPDLKPYAFEKHCSYGHVFKNSLTNA
ncbi:hypothetical protein [Nitrogeniibacter aestuarii]|uniref:hypothetical protein n=1 Tax=Nitrogeniibacter aestuarii TaxID=2815343 RepID=UPI001D11FC0E|nr:hypothetical protein [Nitrogeniibacter aestuarii]